MRFWTWMMMRAPMGLLPFQIAAKAKRKQIVAALAKPLPVDDGSGFFHGFNPWVDIIDGINGSYAEGSDALMIAALEAVRDRKTFEFIADQGFVAEFALYVLSGQGLTDYGTSPRGGFPILELEDLWPQMIEKWQAYSVLQWSEVQGD